MNKKILFIIFSVVIIVVIGVVLLSTKPEEKPEEERPEEVQKLEDVNKILKEVIGEENAYRCQQLKNEEDRERCNIIVQATITEDAKVCAEIKGGEEAPQTARMICYDNIVIAMAIAAKDPKICETVGDKTRVDQCKENISVLPE